MCGFVGTTNKHMTSLMLDKQAHRGPDAKGYWADSRISFGHALLDITGAAQTQPYITPEGNILMLNGEIYDATEQNDTAWLGKLLDKYGIAPLSDIDWHGAIAYYNPNSDHLFLIRDQFGTKPLWWRRAGHLEFSTSLKSFQQKESHKPTPNWYMASQFFGDECMWKNTRKVAPGEVLCFKTKTRKLVKRTNLWNPYYHSWKEWNPAEFKQKTIEQVLKVINHGTDNKTALFLSGGFDSTLIASIARQSNKKIVLFTLSPNYDRPDKHDSRWFRNESEMAMKTAKEFNMPIVKIPLTRDDRVQYGKMWLGETHYLWSDHNRQGPRYALCKAAADHGCKVVITGDSGDELFTGYLHHDKRNDPKWCETHTKYLSGKPWFPSKALIDNDQWNSFFGDLLHTSEQNVLATDQTAGMFGMEARVPFLTQRYAHYVFSIPLDVRFRQLDPWGVTTKYLMREVMKEHLPAHVVNRKDKIGWSSPWDNNDPDIYRRWRLRDIEFLRRQG